MKVRKNTLNFINNFDPDIIDVVVSYFAVAGKYAMIFGILFFLLRMLIRAFTGKEKFL